MPGVAGEGDRSSPAQGTWLGPDGPPGSSLLHTPPSSPGPWWLPSPSFGLTSSPPGQLTSPSTAKPTLPFLQGPTFSLLHPHCTVLSPFFSQPRRGVSARLMGASGVTLVLGIILSLLSTARSLPEGGCRQCLHLLPTCTLTMGPPGTP